MKNLLVLVSLFSLSAVAGTKTVTKVENTGKRQITFVSERCSQARVTENVFGGRVVEAEYTERRCVQKKKYDVTVTSNSMGWSKSSEVIEGSEEFYWEIEEEIVTKSLNVPDRSETVSDKDGNTSVVVEKVSPFELLVLKGDVREICNDLRETKSDVAISESASECN